MKMLYIMRAHKCPICGSTNIHRSRRKGIAEQVACRVTPIRPFRCNDCDTRIYALQADMKKSAWNGRGLAGLKFFRFSSLTDQGRKPSLRRPTLKGRKEFRRLQRAETNSEIVDAWRDSIERGDAPCDPGISYVACRKSCMHFRYHS